MALENMLRASSRQTKHCAYKAAKPDVMLRALSLASKVK